MPSFKAEKTILSALDSLIIVLEFLQRSYEIILVIDGVVDATTELVKSKYGNRIKVIEIHTNSGKGNALRLGIQSAEGSEYIGFIDADLDISPDALITAYETLENEIEISLVVGSKLHQESIVVYPFFRRIQSVLFSKIIDILFGFGINDTQTGLKLGKSYFVKKAAIATQTNGFAFDLEFLLEAKLIGAKFKAVPVHVNYQFESTISFTKYLETLGEVFKIFRLSLRKKIKGAFDVRF